MDQHETLKRIHGNQSFVWALMHNASTFHEKYKWFRRLHEIVIIQILWYIIFYLKIVNTLNSLNKPNILNQFNIQ